MLFLDQLPEEIIIIILGFVDKFPKRHHLNKELQGFISIYPNYYKLYINKIYKGYINNFKKYNFDTISTRTKSKYRSFLNQYKALLDIKLSVNIENGIFYYINISNRLLSRRDHGISKTSHNIYTTCIIFEYCHTFYYVKINHWLKIDAFFPINNKYEIVVDLKEHKNWQELHNNLDKNHVLMLYKQNCYEPSDNEFIFNKLDNF